MKAEGAAPVTKHHLSPITAPTIPKNFHLKLRDRFLAKLKETIGANIPKNGVCLFRGIETLHWNWEDVDHRVEQESNFWYLFGVDLADCHALIEIYSGKTILFVPKIDEAYKLWMVVLSNEEIKVKFNIEEVRYVETI